MSKYYYSDRTTHPPRFDTPSLYPQRGSKLPPKKNKCSSQFALYRAVAAIDLARAAIAVARMSCSAGGACHPKAARRSSSRRRCQRGFDLLSPGHSGEHNPMTIPVNLAAYATIQSAMEIAQAVKSRVDSNNAAFS